MTLANRARPRKFCEVIGQESEAQVVKQMIRKGWKTNAIMANGPFGTGKTTFARLIARAMLCDNPQYGVDQKTDNSDGKPYEPCGECKSCLAMDQDNHPNYIEVDAASNGSIQNVREMKELVSYRTGNKTTIICYDESHGLSAAAQNALLQTLEEGSANVLFIFATTDPQKMLPTIKSRCVLLNMKLLRAAQIKERLLLVAAEEKIQIVDKAAALIATYVRGHVRDALMLLEQVGKTAGDDGVTEEMVRTYLRLDKFDDLYQFLTLTEKKDILEKLEELLCNYAASELTQSLGEILVNTYKLKLGTGSFTQVDTAWLTKVQQARGEAILDEAEAVLSLSVDYASINYAIASFAKIFVKEERTSVPSGPARGLAPGGAPTPQSFRKPGT